MGIKEAMLKVWITGGERSLGKTICDQFTYAGHEVKSLSRPRWDLSEEPRLTHRKMLNELEESGMPDVFIHNSGIMKMAWLEDQDIESFEPIIRVNLTSRYVINKALIEWKIKKK